METVATYPINGDTRLAVSYDLTSYALTDFFDPGTEDYGVYFLPRGRHFGLQSHSFGPLTDDFQRLSRIWEEYPNGNHQATPLARRANRAGFYGKLYTFQTQSNYADAYIYADQMAWVNAMIQDINAWYHGEIYTVDVERRELWQNAAGATRETWELSDSISAVIGLDVYSAEHVELYARDYFELPAKVTA